MKTVAVQTGKPYQVSIGRGMLCTAGAWLAGLTRAHTAALIADDTVDALYGETVEVSLAKAGFRVVRMRFPHGEASKTLDTYGKMLNFLAENHLTRSDVVVALGGGVTGDMAGFVAATYLRGIAVAQIPTTFLAMVDSSVGGKTGIDLPMGKNLAGAFHQPLGVLCDPDVLATLPEAVFADGAAEAVKYGVLCDEDLFATLAQGDYQSGIEAVIERCVAIKADVCAEDECEAGRRKTLNLGHTLGHAIEQCSRYTIPHGYAVAIGMVYAARIAVRLGRCEPVVVARIIEALQNNKLPISAAFTPEQLAAVALVDKKRAGDTITFVLPRKIGECELYKLPVDRLPELAAAAMQA